MASCSDRDFVWCKMGNCLELCCKWLRQGVSLWSHPPWRSLFDRFKYPTYDSGKSHLAVFLVAILSFVAMAILALLLSAVPWPSYLVDSARYLLSALAQSVAAILAVSFTVAFVTFQVASSRLTPRAAGIILRSPALHHLLAIGAATILFTLIFLILVPTPENLFPDAWLIGLAVSAAISGVMAGFCILVLTVLFFVYALDYVRAETILDMHSKLLGDQQSCLQQDDKDRERLCSDIQEELQVLTELAEMLIKREDAKTFKLLMERLSEPFGQALDIQDRIPPGQDFQFGPNDFGLVGIYTVSTIGELIDCVDSFAVKTRSQISQTESEDRKKKWSQFEQDWIGPISTTATSLLDMCLRANTTEPLEAVLGILQDLQKPFGSEFIRSHLELWGYNVAMCIQKLDRAAHASGLHARAQKSGPIVFQDEKREHMRVLMDGLRDVIWDCFRHNVDQRLKILDSIVLRTSYDMEAAAPMLKHWGESKEAIRLNSSHLDFVRGITWAAFLRSAAMSFRKRWDVIRGARRRRILWSLPVNSSISRRNTATSRTHFLKISCSMYGCRRNKDLNV
ncbi:DUF2254 domain-containing protein [bacterium]|nr:DUF2254 domain-containing protein [bacterium]